MKAIIKSGAMDFVFVTVIKLQAKRCYDFTVRSNEFAKTVNNQYENDIVFQAYCD